MTRKDYEAFASMIKDNELSYGGEMDELQLHYISGYNDALSDMAGNMCNIFAADNNRFDKDRFLKACKNA